MFSLVLWSVFPLKERVSPQRACIPSKSVVPLIELVSPLQISLFPSVTEEKERGRGAVSAFNEAQYYCRIFHLLQPAVSKSFIPCQFVSSIICIAMNKLLNEDVMSFTLWYKLSGIIRDVPGKGTDWANIHRINIFKIFLYFIFSRHASSSLFLPI